MLTEGMYIADRYEVVAQAGTGGMSDVYKAKDHILGRFVAIKVLKQEFSEDVNFVTKFRTEAQSAAGLEHPNIVNIYDVGSEDGMHYIVMEYVEGITLKTYIEKKGQLTYKEAVSIAIQVGRGIEAAHNKHIVHRDIKPQNIIISTEGKVKVTDFGIARAANNHTIHSDVMGSAHYTSPEQARNGFVDGKSDIYSLGIVMFEMVTGRVPFDGDSTVAVAIQHLQEEMPAPSIFAMGLPVSMEKIILKCTQKSPDRRYDSIGDLLVDLKKVLISPEEDFVTMVPMGEAKTKVISQKEVETIKSETNRVYYENIDAEDEEEEEEEGLLNPKMEKAVTIMGIVAAVIIVVILVAIIGNITGLFRFGGDDGKNPPNQEVVQGDDSVNTDSEDQNQQDNAQTEQVTMIRLLGMTEEEARASLEGTSLGLKVIGSTASEDVPEGQIVTQSVEEGQNVDKHTTIEVTISSGPGEFSAPAVVGKDDEAAKILIEDMGLVAKRDYAYDATIPQGQVISQTPDAGTSVKKGDTVTYIVSRGAETVSVPDVTNKPEADARGQLEAAGFVIQGVTQEYHDTIAAGNVIRQSPNGGEYKNKGAAVNLVVSLGKQTAYYSYHKKFDKPNTGATVIDIELTKAESDELIPVEIVAEDENSITISATNIENCSNGTLIIYWEWTIPAVLDEEGNELEPAITEQDVTELQVSFEKQ